MLLRLAYLSVTNAFALLRLLPMSDRDKDVEILALRQPAHRPETPAGCSPAPYAQSTPRQSRRPRTPGPVRVGPLLCDQALMPPQLSGYCRVLAPHRRPQPTHRRGALEPISTQTWLPRMTNSDPGQLKVTTVGGPGGGPRRAGSGGCNPQKTRGARRFALSANTPRPTCGWTIPGSNQ